MESDSPVIRPARLMDAQGIHHLSLMLSQHSVSVEETIESLSDLLVSDDHRIWVATRYPHDENLENNPVQGWLHGVLTRRLTTEPFIEIGGLVVGENYRRMGIGKGLVEACEAWAEESALAMRVRCRSDREEAHHFYEALGFESLKEQRVFVRTPSLRICL